MHSDGQKNERRMMGRLIRVFAPFTILLIVLIFLNFRLGNAISQRPVAAQATATREQSPAAPSGTPIPLNNGRRAPIATAIANATESLPLQVKAAATQTPIPTLLPGEIALLSGPPAASQFSLSSALAFYWQPAGRLPDRYLYGLHIVGEGVDKLVGVLSEPNLGTGYQVHVIPQSLDLAAGEYYWQVRLMRLPEDVIVGGSEQRPLRLVDTKE